MDRRLRALSRREALCRDVLGRLARRFLWRAGHRRLGFARVDDYARERLGISGRELQELGRVARGLEGLPRVAAAFRAGELSWSHVRLLVSVATAQTEAAWLFRARGTTVRALADLVAAGAPADADDDFLDGEQAVHVHVACPRLVWRLWMQASELASRMEGRRVPAWAAAEAVAAEGASVGLDGREDRSARSRPVPPESRGGPAWERSEPDPVPEAIERLASPAVCDVHRLDRHLRMALAALQAVDWETGRLLAVLAARRLHQAVGVPTFRDYVRERLGMSLRRARALMAVDRAARRFAVLEDAYRGGRLSMARALVILPVLQPESVAAWVARAQEVTVRRLGDLVAFALEAGDEMPPAAEEELKRARAGAGAVRMCARALDAEVHFRAPVTVAGLFHAAVRAFTPAGEPRWRGLERLLRHACDEWRRQPRHRDAIFERDGWRCAVPGCTARASLHDHHVVYRSRGGDNARANRVTVCAWHHLHGIHGLRLRVDGVAPHDLTWAVGLRPPLPPLMRTHGDRYLEPYSGALDTLSPEDAASVAVAS